MNKRELYKNIMKNVMHSVNKVLHESLEDNIETDMNDMTAIMENWESAMENWLTEHISETKVFIPIMLIANDEWDEQLINEWVESVMNILASEDNLIMDELFVNHITSWLHDYMAADFYNKVITENKNISVYE